MQWTRDGYAPGADWDVPAARDASGGEWERPAGDASSLADGALSFSLSGGAALRFRAVDPAHAPTGTLVRLEGRARVYADPDLAEPPSATIAALAVAASGGGARALNAWTAALGWTPLSGTAPADGAWIDWAAELDLAAVPPAARFSVGGETRTRAADGAEWLPLGVASGAAPSGVGFTGDGETGDFLGSYYDVAAALRVARLVLADAGADVRFASGGGNPDGTFAIELARTEPGLRYVVFAANELSPDPADWLLVACRTAPDANGLSISFSTKDHPQRFFLVYTATADLPSGVATLADLPAP